ncbi:MAG: YkgJ family cysteine cluster protein [Planctomycetes bacterium]|nr:YkgJ family cysteine cluster protein [Planctomycetota bacterium]
MSEPDWPFTFACRRSGNCCAQPGGFVRVDAATIAAMADHLGMTESGFRSRFVAPSGDRLQDGLGGRCCFLEERTEGDRVIAACAVYPVRPARCRSWPFWPELLRSPDHLAAAHRLCPGLTPARHRD